MSRGTVWDVIVIGAGVAGSIAARALAKQGRSVLLVDRAQFPRTKVCGCCLNAAALATLAAVGLDDLPARLGAVPLKGLRLAAATREADIPLAGVALSREALDTALCDAAAQAGAVVRLGVRAVLGAGEPDGISVTLAHDGQCETATARVVLAAHGLAGSRDSARAGSRIGAGVVLPEATAFYSPGHVFMATGAGGYVGLVRLEDQRLDVAACLDTKFLRECGGPAAAVCTILGSVGWPNPNGLADPSWKGTPTLTRRARRVAGPRLFLIGDAAGYVEPFTGEGMAWAMQSAVAVVPLVIRGVESWHDALAQEWITRHARLFRGHHRMCRGVAEVLRNPWATRQFVRLVARAPILSRPLVAWLNRPVLPFPKAVTA